jgi:hypothetical protein
MYHGLNSIKNKSFGRFWLWCSKVCKISYADNLKFQAFCIKDSISIPLHYHF